MHVLSPQIRSVRCVAGDCYPGQTQPDSELCASFTIYVWRRRASQHRKTLPERRPITSSFSSHAIRWIRFLSWVLVRSVVQTGAIKLAIIQARHWVTQTLALQARRYVIAVWRPRSSLIFMTCWTIIQARNAASLLASSAARLLPGAFFMRLSIAVAEDIKSMRAQRNSAATLR